MREQGAHACATHQQLHWQAHELPLSIASSAMQTCLLKALRGERLAGLKHLAACLGSTGPCSVPMHCTQGGAGGCAAQGQGQLAVRLRGGHAAAGAQAGAGAAGEDRPRLRHARRRGCRLRPARWRTVHPKTECSGQGRGRCRKPGRVPQDNTTSLVLHSCTCTET